MGASNILVVDDDEAVRTVTSEMLARLGFAVTAADGGEQALLELERGEFQVVLLDYAMPSMSGMDVYRAMRERGVGARVIFMTGYSEEEFKDLFAEDPDVAVLAKPFPMQELKHSIEGALA